MILTHNQTEDGNLQANEKLFSDKITNICKCIITYK